MVSSPGITVEHSLKGPHTSSGYPVFGGDGTYLRRGVLRLFSYLRSRWGIVTLGSRPTPK